MSVSPVNDVSWYTPSGFPEAASLPSSGSEQTVNVHQAVQDVLDLSVESRDLLGTSEGLTGEERDRFLTMLANLLEAGIIGYEWVQDEHGHCRQTCLLPRGADSGLQAVRAYRT